MVQSCISWAQHLLGHVVTGGDEAISTTITLHQQSPIILGKNPKRERKIQSRSPVFLFTCNSHLKPREPCGSRHHRPSKDTRTRPVRSRTSPSILNTKHTDKDRKLDEPPHGDHGVYKEPTRLSRTSSYLNSISLNLRPPDRLQGAASLGIRIKSGNEDSARFVY